MKFNYDNNDPDESVGYRAATDLITLQRTISELMFKMQKDGYPSELTEAMRHAVTNLQHAKELL